ACRPGRSATGGGGRMRGPGPSAARTLRPERRPDGQPGEGRGSRGRGPGRGDETGRNGRAPQPAIEPDPVSRAGPARHPRRPARLPLARTYPAGRPRNSSDGVRVEGSPRMIAPGDTVTVRVQSSGTHSVSGLWRGTPRVEVLNAAELGCAPVLAGVGRDDSWENGIRTKSTSKR